jgi:hypothetical protein
MELAEKALDNREKGLRDDNESEICIERENKKVVSENDKYVVPREAEGEKSTDGNNSNLQRIKTLEKAFTELQKSHADLEDRFNEHIPLLKKSRSYSCVTGTSFLP